MTEYRKGDVCSLEVVVEGENPLRAGSFMVKFPCGDHGFYLSEHLTLIRRAPVDLATCELPQPVAFRDGTSKCVMRSRFSEETGHLVATVQFEDGTYGTYLVESLRPLDEPAPESEVERLREGLEAAAHFHDVEAKFYSSNSGTKDGIPFNSVAAWHRNCASRIRVIDAVPPITPTCPPGHIMLGDRAVPEPMREVPEIGVAVCLITITDQNPVFFMRWNNSTLQNLWLQRGLIHSTEANARAHAEAIIALSAGEGVA